MSDVSSHLLRSLESSLKISRYSQTSVTISANAAYHSATWGAPAWTPPSMKSKSMMRLSAATVTTKKLSRLSDSAEPDANGDGDRDHAERGEPEVHGCREPDPFLVAHAGRGEDRHQGAVRRREELAQSRPVLVGEHGNLPRQAEQVRERDQNRQRQDRMTTGARHGHVDGG